MGTSVPARLREEPPALSTQYQHGGEESAGQAMFGGAMLTRRSYADVMKDCAKTDQPPGQPVFMGVPIAATLPESYSASQGVTMPNVAPGNYYLIAYADATQVRTSRTRTTTRSPCRSRSRHERGSRPRSALAFAGSIVHTHLVLNGRGVERLKWPAPGRIRDGGHG
jgi:hypothetical protein